MRAKTQSCLLVTIALLCVSDSSGQSTFATITGNVIDPAGAAVPAAIIEATHVQRNQTYRGVANEDGQYTVPNLTDGTYTVTVKAAGFQEFKAEEVILPAVISAVWTHICRSAQLEQRWKFRLAPL